MRARSGIFQPGVVVLVVLGSGAFLGAKWITAPTPQLRTVEYFNDMANSPAYKSQSLNPVFEDGLTQRIPPAGTIARGYLPLDSAAILRQRAVEALGQNEDTATNYRRESDLVAAVERGSRVFGIHCAPCHGADAMGMGPVARRGFPPPPSLLAENACKMSDGEIFLIISHGRGNMPALQSQVDREDRWKAALFIRSLQDQPGGSEVGHARMDKDSGA